MQIAILSLKVVSPSNTTPVAMETSAGEARDELCRENALLQAGLAIYYPFNHTQRMAIANILSSVCMSA